MKTILQIVLIDSWKELIRYKSFFFLIFILIIFDRVLRFFFRVDRSALQIPNIQEVGIHIAPYVFRELPTLFQNWFFDLRIILIVIGLFLLKQLISMWPSSDMRRMHREERGKSGIWGSLVYLRWKQFAWDAIAVGSICAVTLCWILLSFWICRIGWMHDESLMWLLLFMGSGFLITPITLAGFSYSSKLAVLSQGSFQEKLLLFFKLYTDWSVFWKTWSFYLFRIIIEGIFVAIIPMGILLTVDHYFLRIGLASLSATPVYSYVKMASFKFFLEIYQGFPLVKQEYAMYFKGEAR